VRAAPPWPLHRRAAKRLFDLAISSAALAALGPPLLAIGAAVRATSRGPALFRQERVGREGRRFRIWKFRTMVDGAAANGPEVTASGDPRVTPLGRLLRRTKIDELPQLVNVWLGDMSLVGPRPEVPKFVARYSPDQRSVLAVRPGITDPASVRYRDEERVLAGHADRERAYAEILMPKKLALAKRYVARQSFAGDLAILWETALAVAKVPGMDREVSVR
jgi:lipopolysaccharide/colanic/teichoic acid biosynthesis glycosyltransferase